MIREYIMAKKKTKKTSIVVATGKPSVLRASGPSNVLEVSI